MTGRGAHGGTTERRHDYRSHRTRSCDNKPTIRRDRFAVGSAVNQAVRQIGSVLGVSVTVAFAGSLRGPDILSTDYPRTNRVRVPGPLLTPGIVSQVATAKDRL